MTRFLIHGLTAVVFALLTAVSAHADSITIAWDPNPEPDVAGYVVSYGIAPERYEAAVDVGRVTTWTLASAAPGVTYYFTVQAYNTTGQRSPRAREVSATVPAANLAPGSPIGVIDTPLDGAAGVTGSVAVTGWAVDDSGVASVKIYREPVAGEAAAGLIFIGEASFVEGARPDVALAYPGYPGSTAAGWGYLLLTNMLPNRGTGTYVLHAVATDRTGAQTNLGRRTITCTNSTATRPFGAIDSPAQGATVSGGLYHNFGWVLSSGERRADPVGGGTVTVLIDGVPVGSPSGWTSRADIAALFPAHEYAGIGTAAGVFSFDTTALADGRHTIAWLVSDNQTPANTDGIGSRYFTVANSAASGGIRSAEVQSTVEHQPSRRLSLACDDGCTLESQVAEAVRGTAVVLARRGYDLDAPFRRMHPAGGGITIHGEELDRFELRPEGPMWTAGYLRYGDRLSPLPIGSRLDPATGFFTWQPGPGFVGTYDLVFVHWTGGAATTATDVRIVLHPKGSHPGGPRVMIDTPAPGEAVASGRSVLIAGWALDLDAPAGTGIPTLHAWAYPAGGAPPIFLGVATTGGRRPDVAAVFGSQFLASGYDLFAPPLPPGDYDLAVFAWSAATGGWLPARTVRVTIAQ